MTLLDGISLDLTHLLTTEVSWSREILTIRGSEAERIFTACTIDVHQTDLESQAHQLIYLQKGRSWTLSWVSGICILEYQLT